MPDAQALLLHFGRVAHEGIPLAIVWHAVVAAGVVATALGLLCPSRRQLALWAVLPVCSVALVAQFSGDALHATLFGALSLLLLLAALRLPRARATLAWRPLAVLGGLVITFALVYPAFAHRDALWKYAYEAPLGLLASPTLTLIVGLGLLVGGLRSRSWASLVGISGLAYGLWAVLWLGIWLDLVLVVASAALVAHTVLAKQHYAARYAERDSIDAFLASRRIAFVGASTDPLHFSRTVMSELVRHGMDVVPVHPYADEVAGCPALSCLSDIEPPVEGVLIMTPAGASTGLVQECAALGIARVWLFEGIGPGSTSAAAVRSAHDLGLEVVAGRCPLMFLRSHAHGIHRAHAVGLRLAGRYPRSKVD